LSSLNFNPQLGIGAFNIYQKLILKPSAGASNHSSDNLMPPHGEILVIFPITCAVPALYSCPGNRHKQRVTVVGGNQ
jgi:hypothetical protein